MRKVFVLAVFTLFVFLVGCKSDLAKQSEDWLADALGALVDRHGEIEVDSVQWICAGIENGDEDFFPDGKTCMYYVIFSLEGSDEERYAIVQVDGNEDDTDTFIMTRSLREDFLKEFDDDIEELEKLSNWQDDDEYLEYFEELMPNLIITYDHGKASNRDIRSALR